jgi:glutamate carboxypeptidase
MVDRAAGIDLEAVVDGIMAWVAIESPTTERARVNTMLDRVIQDLAGLPIAMERIPGRDGFADIVAARTAGAGERPGILVLSHVDTVHPVGTLTGPLTRRREADRLYGPGIYDMKGGAYLAMEAFRRVVRAGSHRLPITFLFTPDEEVGSLTSRPVIEREAKTARAVLVTEPARDGGRIVTARKGVGRFEVGAEGVPSHSGARHEDGRSAIREIAHQVLAIEAMTDPGRGVTTTVGTIVGGTAPNVVPQHCRISVDLRVRDAESGRVFTDAIRGLRPHDPDVTLTVTGQMNRPAFEKTPEIAALLTHAQGLAREIGFDLQDCPMAGGGSDGNFTADLGIPTLDGLGIDGDGAHTLWEHGLISSIEPRLRLMQRLLETLA